MIKLDYLIKALLAPRMTELYDFVALRKLGPVTVEWGVV